MFLRNPILLASISGFIFVSAFPPINFWPLSLIGLTPLIGLARHLKPQKAFIAGLSFGLTFGFGIFYWLMTVMITYGNLPYWLAIILLLGMQLYLSIYIAVFTSLTAWLLQHKISLFSTSFIWTSLEWIRGQILTGFPWLPLSGALTSFPPLLQSCEIWGATGLSGIIVLINSLILYTIISPRTNIIYITNQKTRYLAAILTIILIFIGWIWGQLRIKQINELSQKSTQIAVSIIQANIPLKDLWTPTNKEKILKRHLELTLQAAQKQKKRPWLVVWPESAIPSYFLYNETYENQILLNEIKKLKIYLSLGSAGIIEKDNKLKITNRTWLIGPNGIPHGFYDKIHLVPFGEYVPILKNLLIRNIPTLIQDLDSGPEEHALITKDLILGPLICYESIFSELAKKQREQGSTLIINQTNDAWFGHTGASAQQLSHLVIRAVENRIACIRAANTGYSAFILPDGRVEKITKLFIPAMATMYLPILNTDTLFTAVIGDIIGPSAIGITLILIIWTQLVKNYKAKIIFKKNTKI